jgi:hypothetical protein
MRFISNDADVVAYVLAVESADGNRLEDGVIAAYNSFITGCKTDGIWTALKASCILAGARTLNGALVPLVGTAPTNANFVSGDYNRKTGLIGNGSTKFINSNRNNNADPQSSRHFFAHVTSATTIDSSIYIGMGLASGASTGVIGRTTRTDFRIQTGLFSINGAPSTGGYGVARSSDATTQAIVASNASNRTDTRATSPSATSIGVFAATVGSNFSNCRMAFYSIGENLNLATIETRVSTLITALSAAIP